MFDGVGPWQVVIVLVIVVLFFGNRIPEVMRGLGSGMRELKKGLREDPDKPDGRPSVGETETEEKSPQVR